MIPPPSLVLLITRPGVIRDGLRALLMATGLVHSIVLAEDLPTAKRAIKDVRPVLVILEDSLLAEETHHLLQTTRLLSPETKRLVIVDTVKRKQAFNLSEADFISLKGSSAEELARTIEKLLPQNL